MKHVIEKLKLLTVLFRFDNGIQLFISRLLWPNRGAMINKYGDLTLFKLHLAGDRYLASINNAFIYRRSVRQYVNHNNF
jgi:hypothetical protein